MGSVYSNGHKVTESCEFVYTRRARLGMCPSRLDLALEVFAGDCMSQTRHIAKYYTVDAWDIKGVPGDLPTGICYKTCDSFEEIKKCEGRYAHVFIDSDVGLFGPDNMYCEYHDMLPLAVRAVEPIGGGISANICTEPYDYERHPEWKARRDSYYSGYDSSNLPLNMMAIEHLKHVINAGYDLVDYHMLPRLMTSWGDPMTYVTLTLFVRKV